MAIVLCLFFAVLNLLLRSITSEFKSASILARACFKLVLIYPAIMAILIVFRFLCAIFCAAVLGVIIALCWIVTILVLVILIYALTSVKIEPTPFIIESQAKQKADMEKAKENMRQLKAKWQVENQYDAIMLVVILALVTSVVLSLWKGLFELPFVISPVLLVLSFCCRKKCIRYARANLLTCIVFPFFAIVGVLIILMHLFPL